jgi:hypothetical protein
MDFMGKSRNEMAIFNSKLLVITRGYLSEPTLVTSGKRFQFAIEAMAVESSLIYPAKKVIFQGM